jgi:predicted RNA-binding protein with PUA-like domain
MQYWLMKSEPSCYSIDNLKTDKTEHWDGVRNYQARNFMRDQMQLKDKVFFYHSNAKPTGIAGIAEVCKTGYPDFTAFDPNSDHPDPKSTPEKPRWFMVDVKFIKKFKSVITLQDLKQYEYLKDMKLLQKGNRLSVMPVEKKHWDFITELVE